MSASPLPIIGRKTTPTCSKGCARPDGGVDAARRNRCADYAAPWVDLLRLSASCSGTAARLRADPRRCRRVPGREGRFSPRGPNGVEYLCIPARLAASLAYLGATRLLGVNEPAAPTGSILIEVISSPLGETNIAKLGPSGPPGGPSTV